MNVNKLFKPKNCETEKSKAEEDRDEQLEDESRFGESVFTGLDSTRPTLPQNWPSTEFRV